MLLPWKDNPHQGYELQERRSAKKKGARRQLNSGRTWSGKGDVRHRTPAGEMLIDCKDHTDSKSYRITEDEWSEWKSTAHKSPPGCQPMYQLDIGKHRLVVIEEDLWDEILERLS